MRPLTTLLPVLMATSALGLSACRLDSGPTASQMAWPQTSAAPYPADYAEPYRPAAPARIPVGRPVSYDDGWAWADRSYALDRVFYDTPPDYGFYYDDYQPWVWQTDDRWAMYGDPAGDAWRYYYYQPGATRPYFIRTNDYGYGYDDVGRLIAIFNLLTGQPMPQSYLYSQDALASGYYQRAYLVREASLRADPVVITRDVWLRQQPVIVRNQNVWIQAAERQPDWIRYRERTDNVFQRAFDDDRRKRETQTYAAAGRDRPARPWLGGVFGRQDDRNDQGRQARVDRADHGGDRPLTVAQAPQDGRALAQARDEQRRARADVERQVREDRGPSARRDQERPLQVQEERQQREQRQVQAQAERQQRDQQRQARAQAERQQRDQQRQVQAQAERQQRDQQRQAQAQAERQQRDQQRQAQAQAERQQHDQQRQAQAQAERQQRDQQRQVQAQAERQQHEQQQRQAQSQPQQRERAQQAQPSSGQANAGKGHGGGGNREAAADQPKGHGKDKKS